jgi:hypothetical protein
LVSRSRARLSDDLTGEAKEYGRIRHRAAHNAGQELLCVNDRQLSAFLCRFHIYAFGHEARAEDVPVGERRHEYDTLTIRNSGTGEPTDSAVQEVWILIELDNMIAWDSIRDHSVPWLLHAFRVKLTVH